MTIEAPERSWPRANHGSPVVRNVASCLAFRKTRRAARPLPLQTPVELVINGERKMDGAGTILLVDDDAGVRSLLGRLLSRSGYRTEVAESGPRAIELATGLAAVDVLLTDVVMPGMSGYELAGRLRGAWTPVPAVIFMSGYSDDALVRSPTGAIPGARFLQKPFEPADLLALIREVLSGRSGAGRGGA